jgi:hypothetical protein
LKAVCNAITYCLEERRFWFLSYHFERLLLRSFQYSNGRIEARVFRSGRTETREIRAKMFITANKIILFNSEEDGGLERRFHYYRCRNRLFLLILMLMS